MKASELITHLAAQIAEHAEDLEVVMLDSYHLTIATPVLIEKRELNNWDNSSIRSVFVLSSLKHLSGTDTGRFPKT